MQPSTLARVQATVVATRGEDIHIFPGTFKKPEAILKAQGEHPYPDGTTFIVLWMDIDATNPSKSAAEINERVRQVKALSFK